MPTRLFAVLLASCAAVGCTGNTAPGERTPATSPPASSSTVSEPSPTTTAVAVEPVPVATGGGCSVAADPDGPWDSATAAGAAADFATAALFVLDADRPLLEAAAAALDVAAVGGTLDETQLAAVASAAAAIAPLCGLTAGE